MHLGADALSVWSRAVHSAAKMTSPLFELLDLVPTILPQAERTPEVCRIVEEYALLVPQELVMVSCKGPFTRCSTDLPFCAFTAPWRSNLWLIRNRAVRRKFARRVASTRYPGSHFAKPTSGWKWC
jgi:hypothetical protein